MHTITRTTNAPAQNLKGVAIESAPDCFGSMPGNVFKPFAGVPAGRRIVSVWLENTTADPATVTVTATPSNQSFTVPPRSSGNYDVDANRTGTAVSAPTGVNYIVHLAPL